MNSDDCDCKPTALCKPCWVKIAEISNKGDFGQKFLQPFLSKDISKSKISYDHMQFINSTCHTFVKKNFRKCDNLGTFTQKVLFLDNNKTKKCDNLGSWTLLYIPSAPVLFLSKKLYRGHVIRESNIIQIR